MKKKILAMLLVMTLVFPLVWVESSQAAGDTYIITPEIGVNLRAEPKQEGATVTKLKQGYRVEVLEEKGKWMKVSYEGKEGYVKSEYLKPLDIDLVAAYKHYATVLEETMGEWTYSLLYDFTQDGLEELYIVEEDQGGWLRHRMFSGEKELFDELIHYDKGELTIYWDDYNYYIMTHNYYFYDNSFKMSEVGISSQHELVHANMYSENINIIHSGNLALNKMRVGMESSQILSRFETNGEYFDVGENDFEINLYSVEGKEVTKEQWEKTLARYKNAPNHLVLYGGSEDALNFDETLDKLYALYEKYNDSPIELSLEETKIEEIKGYTYYINYMFDSGSIKDVNSGEIDYFELLHLALYYSEDWGELYDEEEYKYKYPKLKIDEWMYNNFGVRVDNQQWKDHILRYETEYEKEYGGKYGLTLIEVHDEYYLKSYIGDGITMFTGEYEPYIINSHQLEDNFIALEYVMYGPIKELSIMSAKPDYIIVKKVKAANGETYYPYIDTVQTLENIDYYALNKYAEMLDVVKDNKQVDQGSPVEPVEGSVDKQDEEALVKESKEQGKTANAARYTLVIIGGLVLVIAVVVMNVRKRRNGSKIKKTTTIMMIVFSVIVVGSAIFMSINPSQPQTESDTSLDDDTQEDSNSVADDEQESNDLEDSEVDASETEIPDVSDEDAIPPVTENTNSTTGEEKSNYIASIQYAENLLNDAGTSGDFTDNLWDAYGAWDDELNRIYGLLKEKISPQKMEALRTEQRAWIKERDQQANPELVDSFAEIEILNNLVRERTLYLVDMYFDEE